MITFFTATVTWLADHGPLGIALPLLGTAAILTATITLAMKGSRHDQ